MIADYVLPGSVIALKFLFRLFIGQQVTKTEVFKAILSFPVDLAFLAVSFSAIILPGMQTRPTNPLSTKDVMYLFVVYIVIAFVVTAFSRHSDNAFVKAPDKPKSAILWATPAYFLSILVIVLSLRAIGT
jgi:hypothetical protein